MRHPTTRIPPRPTHTVSTKPSNLTYHEKINKASSIIVVVNSYPLINKRRQRNRVCTRATYPSVNVEMGY